MLSIFTPKPLPPSYIPVILIQRSAFASVDTLTVQLEVETGLRVRLRQQRVMRAAKFIMLMYAKRFPPCNSVTVCSCASPCITLYHCAYHPAFCNTLFRYSIRTAYILLILMGFSLKRTAPLDPQGACR